MKNLKFDELRNCINMRPNSRLVGEDEGTKTVRFNAASIHEIELVPTE